MKVSVITPSYNQVGYLPETLASVLNQRHEEVEHIVIDGASSDGSIELLKECGASLAHWESVPDRGQAHAINKGVRLASGEIVSFLNSDDVYLPGAFEAVTRYFRQHPDCEWLCGDTLMFGTGHATGLVRADVPRSAAHCLNWAYTAPQPGMFWRRQLLDDGFDEQWRYCFDHELYVRLLLAGHRCHYLPVPVAAYRLHCESKTVAEHSGFHAEFDAIAIKYEAHLRGRARNWCRATLELRRSCALIEAGDRAAALRHIIRAFATYPEACLRRPLWGCIRRLFVTGTQRR